MNVRIVYGSLTGNTRRVAEAIGKELAVLPRAAKEPQSLEGGDLLFLGSGVYGGRPAGAVRRLLNAATSLAGVKVALFGTYGGTPNQLDWMARAVQERRGRGPRPVQLQGARLVRLGPRRPRAPQRSRPIGRRGLRPPGQGTGRSGEEGVVRGRVRGVLGEAVPSKAAKVDSSARVEQDALFLEQGDLLSAEARHSFRVHYPLPRDRRSRAVLAQGGEGPADAAGVAARADKVGDLAVRRDPTGGDLPDDSIDLLV